MGDRLAVLFHRLARGRCAGGIVLGGRPEQFEFLSPENRETPGLDLAVERVEDTGAVVPLRTTA